MLLIDSDYNISLTRGDTGLLSVNLTDEEGKPFVPSEGDSMRFAMSKKYGSTVDEVLILKGIPIDTMVLEITPEDTKSLDFGAYNYDIEYTDSFGRVSTIIMAKFTITKEVY